MYIVLIIVGSYTGKTDALLNLIIEESNIDKIHLCTKHPYKHKGQHLISKIESISEKAF